MPLIINPVEHCSEDYDLDPEVIADLWRMEDRHFWHHAWNRWITKALRRYGVRRGALLLEIGCGSGVVASHLHRAGYDVTGIDTAEVLVRKAHERCPAATFVVGDITVDSLPSEPFDVVGLFDVLEHLGDPLEMVRAAGDHARRGAVMVATVPAQRSLHSVIDDLSGHKKRYETGELAELLRTAGLNGVEEHAIFHWITPMLRRLRTQMAGQESLRLTTDERRKLMRRNLRVPPEPLNWGLATLCDLERGLRYERSRGMSGTSLLALGRFG